MTTHLLSWFAPALVLGVVLPAGEASADRPAVESVLAEMTRAVLAGDGSGYLRCVDHADPIFLKEQENWAKDLDTYVPVEFAMSIEVPAEPKPDAPAATPPAIEPVFGVDEARFTLVTTWKMPKSTRSRKVAFPARFVRRGEQWLYAGEDWLVVERPADPLTGFRGVRVKHFAGMESTARRIADVAPEVRSAVDTLLGITVEQVQEVKLYKAMNHLQQSIYLSYTDGLGGWNEPGESIKFLGGSREMGPGSVKSLLAHEYGHVATFAYGSRTTDAPWWLVEGVAEFSAGRFRTNPVSRRDGTVIAWAKAGNLAPWDAMADFRATDRKWGGNVYTQGEHMVAFITDQFGDDARDRLLTELGRQSDFRSAFLAAIGVPFDDVDARWQALVMRDARAQAAGVPFQ